MFDISQIKDVEFFEEEKLKEEAIKKQEGLKKKAEKQPENEGENQENEEENVPTNLVNNSVVLFKEGMTEAYNNLGKFYGLKESNIEFYVLNGYKRRVLSLNRELVKLIQETANDKLRIVNIGQRALEKVKDEKSSTPVKIVLIWVFWLTFTNSLEFCMISCRLVLII